MLHKFIDKVEKYQNLLEYNYWKIISSSGHNFDYLHGIMKITVPSLYFSEQFIRPKY